MSQFRARRRPKPRRYVLLDDLYDYANPRPPSRVHIGRPVKHDLSTWTVTDDWPEHVPVTEAEVDLFEAWFGDLLDKLFGPCP
jgi:hypothetical protein